MEGQPLPAVQAALTQDKYAIVVGVNEYYNPAIRDLRYCVNDASEFRDVLINECGYPAGHVVLLTDAEATRNRLENELEQLTNRGLYPNADTIIFYYSGHGAVINGQNYLIPHDGSPDPNLAQSSNLSLEHVQGLLASSDFPRQIILADSCRVFYNTIQDSSTARGYTPRQSLVAAQYATGMKVLFSNKFGRISLEETSLGHGVFTHYVLEGLRGRAKDEFGAITFRSLEEFVHSEMISYSMNILNEEEKQIPVSSGEGNPGMLIAVVEEPGNDPLWLADQERIKGNARYNLGDFQGAEEHYRRALQLYPAYAPGHNNLGLIYKQQGKMELALESWNAALTHDPQLAEAYVNIGNVYMEQQNYTQAQANYEQAISANGQYVIAHYNLGRVYLSQRNADAAIRCFRNAIDIDPNFASAYVNLGMALKRNGETAAAEKNYEHAIELSPDNAVALFNLGNIYYERGDDTGAIRFYEQAINANHEFAPAYFGLGMALYYLGRFDESYEAFNNARLFSKPGDTICQTAEQYLSKPELAQR